MEKSSKILASDKIGSLIIKLSVPATIGMIVQALYNVVDAIFVGRGIGTLGLAGITVVFPIQIFVMAVAQLIGIGSASIVSRSLGEKDFDKANSTLGNAIVLSLISGALISVFVLLFIDPILSAFGSSKTILPYARDYLSVIMYGTVFVTFGMALNSIVRAEGNAKTALYTMLLGAGFNMVLDPLFIFGFKMGIKGAAIATAISQIATFLWLLFYFLAGRSSLKLIVSKIRVSRRITNETISIGLSAFVRQVSASFIMVFINKTLAFYGGDMAITVYGLVNRLASFAIMPSFGVSQGFQPIAGYNYGAKRYDKTIQSIHYGVLFATITTTLGFLIILLFPTPLIRLFTSDVNLINQTINPLRLVTLMFSFVGFMVITATLFQAIGKPVEALILSLARQVIFLIPLIFILPRYFGLLGVWVSFPLADFLTFAVSFYFFFRELKALRGEHEKSKEAPSFGFLEGQETFK